jgi:WD40 repeat protein
MLVRQTKLKLSRTNVFKLIILCGAAVILSNVVRNVHADDHYPLKLYKVINTGGLWGIAWSPDSQEVAGTYDMATKAGIWDVNSGEKLQTIQIIAGGDSNSVFFLPDKNILLTPLSVNKEPSLAEASGALSLWDINKGTVIKTIAGPYPQVSKFNPNRPDRVAMSADGAFAAGKAFHTPHAPPSSAVIYSLNEGKVLHVFDYPPGPDQDVVGAMAFSPDGKYFAVGGFSGAIHLYDVASGQLLRKFRPYADKYKYVAIGVLAFSPDSRFLAGGLNSVVESPKPDNVVNVWKVSDMSLVASYPPDNFYVIRQISWAPNGRTIAFVAGGNTVHVWSLGHPHDPGIVMHIPEDVTTALISPDGKYLAVSSEKLLIFVLPGAIPSSKKDKP